MKIGIREFIFFGVMLYYVIFLTTKKDESPIHPPAPKEEVFCQPGIEDLICWDKKTVCVYKPDGKEECHDK